MERLTRPTVMVDETAAQYMGKGIEMEDMSDRLLELILNGPTLNALNKDVLRKMIRKLYSRLKEYEGSGLTPTEIYCMTQMLTADPKEVERLLAAEAEGRLLVLDGLTVDDVKAMVEAKAEGRLLVEPRNVGDTLGGIRANDLYDEDGGEILREG